MTDKNKTQKSKTKKAIKKPYLWLIIITLTVVFFVILAIINKKESHSEHDHHNHDHHNHDHESKHHSPTQNNTENNDEPRGGIELSTDSPLLDIPDTTYNTGGTIIYPLYRKQIITLLENRPDESVDPVDYLIQEIFEKEIYKGKVKFKEDKKKKHKDEMGYESITYKKGTEKINITKTNNRILSLYHEKRLKNKKLIAKTQNLKSYSKTHNPSIEMNDYIRLTESSDQIRKREEEGKEKIPSCGMIFAMEHKLGDPYYANMYRNIKESSKKTETKINQKTMNQQTNSSCENIIYIPVAVHFQGNSINDSPENKACIESLTLNAIESTNKDIQGINDDISKRETQKETFPGIENGASCIQLCLATHDHPDGYNLSDEEYAITINQVDGNLYVGPNRAGYINIVVQAIGGGVAGESPLFGRGNGDAFRIGHDVFAVGDDECIGIPKAQSGRSRNKGRTFTHELGHYLGLRHIRGNGHYLEENCNDSDNIEDTPNQSKSNLYIQNPQNGCPQLGLSSCDSADLRMNYMDYSPDVCMNMFTNGQKQTMEGRANGDLLGRLTDQSHVSAKCQGVSSSCDIDATRDCTIEANPIMCQAGSQTCIDDGEGNGTRGECIAEIDPDDNPNPEVCDDSDNSDEDCDGFSNCADSDCETGPIGSGGIAVECTPDTGEICNDGGDNDGNGQSDCEDSLCGITTLTLSTSKDHVCAPSTGEQITITATAAGNTTGIVYDRSASNQTGSSIDITITGNTTINLTGINGSGCSQTATIDITFQLKEPEVCSDDIDHDCDGEPKCGDSDCENEDICKNPECHLPGNCSKDECQEKSYCGTENCCDGFDNDGDGNIDCGNEEEGIPADPDCINRHPCTSGRIGQINPRLKNAIYLDFKKELSSEEKTKRLSDKRISSITQPFTELDIETYRIEFNEYQISKEEIEEEIKERFKKNKVKSQSVPRFTLNQHGGNSPRNIEGKKQSYLREIGFFSILESCPAEQYRPTIAIIDNAFDTTHSDINRSTAQQYDSANNDYDIQIPDDVKNREHGTKAAGIIAASHNNDGIIGIATKQADLIYIKATHDDALGTDITAGIEAVVKAAEMGADIISISRGIYEDIELFHNIIKKLHKKGITIVAAAGNYASDKKFYPAAYKEVIAVGSINQSEDIAHFSNYGERVDIRAPGINIYTTTINNKYTYSDGTSDSTPIVAGALALAYSQGKDITHISRTTNNKKILDSSKLCRKHNAAPSSINQETKEKQIIHKIIDRRVRASMATLIVLLALLRWVFIHPHYHEKR